MTEIMSEKIEKDEIVNDEGDLQVYEVGFHVLPNISEEEVGSVVSTIHDILKKNESSIISEGLPEMTDLSYEMVKTIETRNLRFNKAYFGWVKFEVDRSKVNDIKAKIEVLPSILRFLILKTVKENTVFTPKSPIFRKDVQKDDVSADSHEVQAEKVHVSEAEIDKSIDELLVNEDSKL